MKKLNKDDLRQKSELAARLLDRRSDLETAVEAFNEAVEKAWEKVQEAMEALNEAVADANEWKLEVAAQIQDFMDGKSEKWAEGERGQAYEAWRGQFEEELEPADLSKPESVDMGEIEDYEDRLNQIEEEVS